MMKSIKNIGETGLESIRIGGMQIDNLPIAEAADVKAQMPEAEKTQRENKIADIRKSHPTQRVGYLKGRINEAEDNIERMRQQKARNLDDISSYTSQISLCQHRDSAIDLIPAEDPKRAEKISTLYKQFPPYNVEKMKQQIKQFNEAIVRFDDVIAREYKDIAEMRELLGLCERRDLLLRNLGEETDT